MGQYNGWMGIYAGGVSNPITHAIVDKNEHLVMGNELLHRDDPDEYPRPVDFYDNKQKVTSHTVTRVLAFLELSAVLPPKSDFDLHGLGAAEVFLWLFDVRCINK